MEIIITYHSDTGWVLKYDGKTSDRMSWDEMLGLLASITMPDKRPCLQWLK